MFYDDVKTCVACGRLIARGRYCSDCREEYQNGLADVRYEEARDKRDVQQD